MRSTLGLGLGLGVGVGIVDMDGRLPCRTFNKHHHHGGAVRCYSSMAVANQSPILPEASSKGVVRGRTSRVLFNSADLPRIKQLINSRILF